MDAAALPIPLPLQAMLACCLAAAVPLHGQDGAIFVQPRVVELQRNDHVFVMGDSTTADGLQPAGYVQLVRQAVREQLPDMDITVDGVGHAMKASGSLLGERGQIHGCVKRRIGGPKPPTIAVINFGLNDAGFKYREGSFQQYQDNLRQAVKELRELGLRHVALCATTPYRNDVGADDGVKPRNMKPYQTATRALAAELACPFVDLYQAHATHNARHLVGGKLDPAHAPTRDGCHLSAIGETISATTILQALGLKGECRRYQLRAHGGEAKVTVDPAQESYEPGTVVKVTVEAGAGRTFAGWKGDVDAATPSITVTMDRHKIIWPDLARAR